MDFICPEFALIPRGVIRSPLRQLLLYEQETAADWRIAARDRLTDNHARWSDYVLGSTYNRASVVGDFSLEAIAMRTSS
jgi:hypothetical protein